MDLVKVEIEIPKALYNFLEAYCKSTEEDINNFIKSIMRWGFQSFISIIEGSFITPGLARNLEQILLNNF
ncbi:MAG: hypothetical protein NDF55_09155 [archaeon GB-1867-005]|nr:hypothetical protein [Candidatus Culexmicrobium cathedralense]